jgi:hypothetical protein
MRGVMSGLHGITRMMGLPREQFSGMSLVGASRALTYSRGASTITRRRAAHGSIVEVESPPDTATGVSTTGPAEAGPAGNGSH